MFTRFCNYLSVLTHIPEQFIRFLLIGSLNTAFAYGLYSLFIFIGLHYALAIFFSTIIGIFFSFKTFGKWVFFHSGNRRLLRFFAVYAIGYFLNVGILTALTAGGITNLYLAGLISSFLVAMCSFFLNKFFVFRKD